MGSSPKRCLNMMSYPGTFRSLQCARKQTGDDELCNVCRAAKKRGKDASDRKEAVRARGRAEESRHLAGAERICERLGKVGISAAPCHNGHRYTGQVVVDGEQVLKKVFTS